MKRVDKVLGAVLDDVRMSAFAMTSTQMPSPLGLGRLEAVHVEGPRYTGYANSNALVVCEILYSKPCLIDIVTKGSGSVSPRKPMSSPSRTIPRASGHPRQRVHRRGPELEAVSEQRESREGGMR